MPGHAGGEGMRFVADLRACYRQATATFRIEPAMSMSWLSPVIDAGMVVNQGRDRSARASPAPALEADRQAGLSLHRPLRPERPRLVAAGAIRPRQGVHFVGYYAAPAGNPANLHVVPSPDWPGGDLIASSDAVVAKAGYGTVCEAMASGTPMIYPPRTGFAEFRSLDRGLAGLGRRSADLLARLPRAQARRALGRALSDQAGPAAVPGRRCQASRRSPDEPLPKAQRPKDVDCDALMGVA